MSETENTELAKVRAWVATLRRDGYTPCSPTLADMMALDAEIDRLARELREANGLLMGAGIAELATRNPNLASYMREWEARAVAAEAEVARLQEALTFDAFRRANVTRCARWHPQGISSWSPSDWLTAVMGELGELASLLKMRNRERDGLVGNKFSPTDRQIADEVADVATYLDLLAEALGVDLGAAVARKFNEVSARNGFPDRLPLTSALAPKEASHE